VVVTRDTSDWCLVTAPNPEQMWFQVTRRGATLEVSISGDGATYALFRQCSFVDQPVRVGPFCCSPGDGFTATFSDFKVVTAP
jgi:regulation of enolase protein 1 (concanavalin A-like superfamily)